MGSHAYVVRERREQEQLGPVAMELVDREKAKDERLVLYSDLDETYKVMVAKSLDERNKERILSGLPVYEDIPAMVRAYMEYEGEKEGMTLAEAESEVIKYLQRRALLEEGNLDGDPQTILTFVLLAAVLVGAAYNLITGQGAGAA